MDVPFAGITRSTTELRGRTHRSLVALLVSGAWEGAPRALRVPSTAEYTMLSSDGSGLSSH